jgi:hypothetical protein
MALPESGVIVLLAGAWPKLDRIAQLHHGTDRTAIVKHKHWLHVDHTAADAPYAAFQKGTPAATPRLARQQERHKHLCDALGLVAHAYFLGDLDFLGAGGAFGVDACVAFSGARNLIFTLSALMGG